MEITLLIVSLVLVYVCKCNEGVASNQILVILCKDCWSRNWADMATHYVEMYDQKLFWHPKKKILERDQCYFTSVLS